MISSRTFLFFVDGCVMYFKGWPSFSYLVNKYNCLCFAYYVFNFLQIEVSSKNLFELLVDSIWVKASWQHSVSNKTFIKLLYNLSLYPQLPFLNWSRVSVQNVKSTWMWLGIRIFRYRFVNWKTCKECALRGYICWLKQKVNYYGMGTLNLSSQKQSQSKTSIFSEFQSATRYKRDNSHDLVCLNQENTNCVETLDKFIQYRILFHNIPVIK